MLIGYARVSKADGSQSLDLQRDALQAAGVDAVHVYHDFASGVRDDRPGLDSCVRALRTGDMLVVWKLDRLGRNLAHLLLDLNGQETARALERRLRHYARPALLAIDEIGYLAYDAHAADLLFQIVSRRYEHRPLLMTTNLAFKHWDTIFPNASCAVALIDRLTPHAEIVVIEGDSYRKPRGRAQPETATDQPTETAVTALDACPELRAFHVTGNTWPISRRFSARTFCTRPCDAAAPLGLAPLAHAGRCRDLNRGTDGARPAPCGSPSPSPRPGTESPAAVGCR